MSLTKNLFYHLNMSNDQERLETLIEKHIDSVPREFIATSLRATWTVTRDITIAATFGLLYQRYMAQSVPPVVAAQLGVLAGGFYGTVRHSYNYLKARKKVYKDE